MTSTDSYFSRLPIKRPFASGDGAPVTQIGNDDSSPMNVFDGFTPAYENAVENEGRFVTRGDMNAIGNLASQTQFYFQAGGINTFDQKFAAAVNGYPKDAVLDYLVGTRLYKVVSLKDDNKVDFTGAEPREDGIVAGSVDNENWAYANMDAPVDTRIVACNIPGQLPSGPMPNIISSFVAPKSGTIFADGTFEISPYGQYVVYPTWIGAGFFVIAEEDLDASHPLPVKPDELNGWTPCAALYNWGYNPTSTVSSHVNCTAIPFHVEVGNKYLVAVSCGLLDTGVPCVTNVDMKLYIV